mmetsp:Transcript_29332/g.49181  ORF Transcript_29332/g.49181 Transcript_29332/m.49181 type:complete len:80 (-) Transcript_29332:1319-1558(-)
MSPFEAAYVEAAESTSHLAFATEAAAPNSADPAGNITDIMACNSTIFTKGNNSTDAALAAAQRPASADVKGNIEPARCP